MKSLIFVLIIAAIIFFVYRFITKRFKLPHLNAVNLIVGEVKSGKSITALTLAKKDYKKRLFKVKVHNFFCKIFNRELNPIPLFYSNIPVGFDYVAITTELLNRTKRFVYGSVVFLDEVSFVCDKMLYKDQVICDNVKDFFKLFGHETGGYGCLGHGTLVANTQAISDCSKEFRACLGSMLFIESVSAPFWIPFFGIIRCRQERYSEDGTTVNAYNEDLDQSMCKFLFRKKHFKFYDSACYSAITDDLEVEDTIIHGAELPNLKTKIITSFEKRYQLGEKKNVKEKA